MLFVVEGGLLFDSSPLCKAKKILAVIGALL